MACVSPAPPLLHPPSQLALCDADEDCNAEEFCSTPARGGISGGGGGGGGLVCLTCRKRRKRCFRDAMCCSGNFCNNGASKGSSEGGSLAEKLF